MEVDLPLSFSVFSEYLVKLWAEYVRNRYYGTS